MFHWKDTTLVPVIIYNYYVSTTYVTRARTYKITFAENPLKKLTNDRRGGGGSDKKFRKL